MPGLPSSRPRVASPVACLARPGYQPVTMGGPVHQPLVDMYHAARLTVLLEVLSGPGGGRSSRIRFEHA